MRSLGFNMSEQLALQIAAKLDQHNENFLRYDQFQKYLLR
jgi:hypothetical protein